MGPGMISFNAVISVCGKRRAVGAGEKINGQRSIHDVCGHNRGDYDFHREKNEQQSLPFQDRIKETISGNQSGGHGYRIQDTALQHYIARWRAHDDPMAMPRDVETGAQTCILGSDEVQH